jgi:hypothetical protein
VKFCVDMGHKYVYKVCKVHEAYVYVLSIINMATVRNFDVISDKFSAVLICPNGNYVKKWISKLYNFY